jgi:uncharacterized membrane protein YfcA
VFPSPRWAGGRRALTLMELSALDYLAAGGAAGVAGIINSVAGGGTLVSFPTLVAIGVPPVSANVTNTVALVPGYLGGSWAQRDDLVPQLGHARLLSAVSAAGGLAGSILLVSISAHAFRASVPYLILLSCLLLLGQDRVRRVVGAHGDRLGNGGPLEAGLAAPAGSPGVDAGPGTGAVAPGLSASTRREGGPKTRPALVVSVFAAAVYGGYFGAGLGIMLLAILGVFSTESLTRSNALKQALSLVINTVAAVFFAFSGHVQWSLVPVMAVASIVGGTVGGRWVTRISGDLLRRLVVIAGLGVAAAFWAS